MRQRDRSDLVESVVDAQRAVVRALHAAGPSWLELNLTMAQLKTLVLLADDGPMHIGQIAEGLEVTLPTASYQVDRLVRAGLVSRVEDERDRRRMLVQLSDKADELLRSLRHGRAGQLRAWLDSMSLADLEALARGMAALERIASGDREPATAGARSGGDDDQRV
jgi:MarR family transcriptional regulator, organic hydroperoxide resistance regulator